MPSPAAAGGPLRRPSRTGRFVRRALGEFAALLAGPLSRGNGEAGGGLIHRLDPRAKALGFLGLIVVTTLLAKWPALAADAAVCLALVLAARVPAKRLLGAWLAVPLFSAAVILPATLNLVTPGDVLVPLLHSHGGRFGPWELPENVGVTDVGLQVAGRFAARILLCVTLAMLLARSTRPDRLFHGLRALGVPRVFVMLLTMVERYVAVLLRAAEEIHLAKLSRTIISGSLRQEQAWVAAGAGSLFRRSRSLGNAVYLAMLSRGFTGEARLLEDARWGPADVLFLAAVGAVCAALLAAEGLA